MMDSVRLFFRNFIKYFLYVAVFAQIVSGTVYLVCHFTSYIPAPETKELLDVAKTLVFDEYVSILYPIFLKGCVFVQDITGIMYYFPVYIIQLVMLAFGVWYVTGVFFSGKNRYLASAFVLMSPMCMSTGLSVSPFALKTFFGLLIVGTMVRLWKDNWNAKGWTILFGAYLLAALNERDDLYVWLVPIGVFVSAVLLKKQEKSKIYKKLCIFCVLIIVFFTALGFGKSVSEVGDRDRMQKTFASVLFQRTLWPDLCTKYGFLPMDMMAVISKETAMRSDGSAEQMQYVIGPLLENAYGLERANELYMEAVKNQFSYNKKAILKTVSGDFLGYALTPYSAMGYFTGQEGSAFGKLYSLMGVSHPRIVYGYYCISFVSLFILTFAALLKQVKEKAVVQKKTIKKLMFFIGIILYDAMWYAIANVQGVDYRYVLLNVVLYGCFALSSILKTDYKERDAE